ncbi:ABC-type amino acid transport substrate-binding protein [Oxalobacteraceae bacterium GrIS 1.11]
MGRFSIGQGKGWADVAILEAARLSVVEGTSYEGLFSMLMAGRFDLFSRSVDEAVREYGERRASHPELALEPTLLLSYPLPRYFFVRRDAEGRQLAARIEAGLEIMLRDGTLNTLFYQF